MDSGIDTAGHREREGKGGGEKGGREGRRRGGEGREGRRREVIRIAQIHVHSHKTPVHTHHTREQLTYYASEYSSRVVPHEVGTHLSATTACACVR